MNKLISAGTAWLFMLIPVHAQTTTWDIDPAHSSAQFTVSHMMVSNVRSEFMKVSGKVSLDQKNLSNSSFVASIDVSSINIREPRRDEHLKCPDFFDVTEFPTIASKSARVSSTSSGSLKIIGDLTIHGATCTLELQISGLTSALKDPSGRLRRGASATTIINRKNYGLTLNKLLESGGVLVGEKVAIHIDVELGNEAKYSTRAIEHQYSLGLKSQ